MTVEPAPYSPKLAFWYIEAFAELGLRVHQIDANYAILPRKLYEAVQALDHTKIHDFCFIGAYRIDEETERNRRWIIDFIQRNFTGRSYLQFTDRKTKAVHTVMGPYDHTFERDGFVPKEVDIPKRNVFDAHYYQVMCQSRFTLCPAGDVNWSLRFYEALMCRSIPILFDEGGFRTRKERDLPYGYGTVQDRIAYCADLAQHNHELFLRHHTLRYWRPPLAAPAPNA